MNNIYPVIDTVVTLNMGEQCICNAMGHARSHSNRTHGVVNAKIGMDEDLDVDIMGFAGELAFCKLFNIMPDFSIDPINNDMDEGDCVLAGMRVDVKQTKYGGGKLLAAKWKGGNPVELYALMTGTMPTFIFRGFMWADELLRPERLVNLGYGDTYAGKQYELLEFETIINSERFKAD